MQEQNQQIPQAAPNTPITISDADMARAQKIISMIQSAFSYRVVGQKELQTSLLVAIMTGGHVLLESVPGLAKTTAAQTLAEALKLQFRRIQCTPDLLPSDIIGSQIYDYSKGVFQTQLGPVHSNVVLLDEINRSSAKTQSAMLEAMQERQTSIGGKLYKLPQPFIVLATQNPIEQEGTYELPEAQLDRFLLKEVLVYPSLEEEVEILNRVDSGVLDHPLAVQEMIGAEEIAFLQSLTKQVYMDQSIKQYIARLVHATRETSKSIGEELGRYVEFGASPRGGIALQQVARALAIIQGRKNVIPEDVKMKRYSILRHRIILNFEAVADKVSTDKIIDAVFSSVQTP